MAKSSAPKITLMMPPAIRIPSPAISLRKRIAWTVCTTPLRIAHRAIT